MTSSIGDEAVRRELLMRLNTLRGMGMSGGAAPRVRRAKDAVTYGTTFQGKRRFKPCKYGEQAPVDKNCKKYTKVTPGSTGTYGSPKENPYPKFLKAYKGDAILKGTLAAKRKAYESWKSWNGFGEIKTYGTTATGRPRYKPCADGEITEKSKCKKVVKKKAVKAVPSGSGFVYE